MTTASHLTADQTAMPLDASRRFERLVHDLKALQRSMSGHRRGVDAGAGLSEHLLRDVGLTRDDVGRGGDLRVWVV